jgi:hypothetical protein
MKFWRQGKRYQAEEIQEPGQETDVKLMNVWKTQVL